MLKTKEIRSILMLVALSMLVIPFVSATEEVSDEELTDEIETMGLPERGVYRFEQLRISIENQVEYGKDILSELEVSDEVMSKLEGYIIDLEVLQESINTIDLTGSPANLAAEFLEIKKEAISISQNFKTTMNQAVRAPEIEQIKANFAEMKELRKEEAKLRIEEKKAEASAKRGVRLLEELGIEVDEGRTPEETKTLVKEALNALSDEEKEELKAEIKAERETAKANLEAKKAEAKANMKTKREEIKAELQAKREAKRAKLKADLEERKNNMQAIKTGMKEKLEERKAGMKAKSSAE